ncbi:MAG: hypothetical protein A3E88_02960 [Legionellales bacterium RIFCSPHIGHO2_12_FULL_35_11]|nr:MAG: hypothetical protein A3E88_02960 [Legionellales bacterium RIFCSPHIGHO2_12_FULL_35_11]
MRHISQCLNSKIAKTCMQTKKISDISNFMQNIIPNDILNNCKVGSFLRGSLVIIVNDAVWASQLRYLLPEIRDKLRNEMKLYELSSIKISIDKEIFKNKQIDNPINSLKNIQKSPWSSILNDLKNQ